MTASAHVGDKQKHYLSVGSLRIRHSVVKQSPGLGSQQGELKLQEVVAIFSIQKQEFWLLCSNYLIRKICRE